MNNQYKLVNYNVGDIILEIDPTRSPVQYKVMVLIEKQELHSVLQNTADGQKQWFAKAGMVEINGTKLKIDTLLEFHYYPNEKNKSKNR